jgi:hypothetical protein
MDEMIALNIYAESKRVALDIITLALLLDVESMRVVNARDGGYRLRIVLRRSALREAISGLDGDQIAYEVGKMMERVQDERRVG